jgi:hypothetical protein
MLGAITGVSSSGVAISEKVWDAYKVSGDGVWGVGSNAGEGAQRVVLTLPYWAWR